MAAEVVDPEMVADRGDEAAVGEDPGGEGAGARKNKENADPEVKDVDKDKAKDLGYEVLPGDAWIELERPKRSRFGRLEP